MTLIPELDIALITSGYARSRGIENVTGGVLLYDFKDNRSGAKKLKIKGINLVSAENFNFDLRKNKWCSKLR